MAGPAATAGAIATAGATAAAGAATAMAGAAAIATAGWAQTCLGTSSHFWVARSAHFLSGMVEQILFGTEIHF